MCTQKFRQSVYRFESLLIGGSRPEHSPTVQATSKVLASPSFLVVFVFHSSTMRSGRRRYGVDGCLMADEQKETGGSPLRYEGEIPIFPGKVEREESARHAEKEEEIKYREEQTRIQRGLLTTQKALVLFGILGALISWYEACTAGKSADAAKSAADTAQKQFLMYRDQVIGTSASVLEDESPHWDLNKLSFGLSHRGQLISTNTTINVRITPLTFPGLRQLGQTRSYSEMIPQIDKGWGMNYPAPFSAPPTSIESQSVTIKIEGNFNYDNGFGQRFDKTFCYLYIGSYVFDIAPQSQAISSGGNSFYTCSQFPIELESVRQAKLSGRLHRPQNH